MEDDTRVQEPAREAAGEPAAGEPAGEAAGEPVAAAPVAEESVAAGPVGEPTDLESPDDIALADKLKAGREEILTELHKLIVGQQEVIEQALLTLFVGGNSIIVGVPGLAKTLLIQTMAQVLDLKFARIQFTPDLMPSDITGTDIIQEDAATGGRKMVFAPGPVFTNILLADEINRTPPKTQSALLEAMQEHRVTVQGRTYDLEEPFFVFATQNPIELEGTYPLPEAQLDRFMFHIVIEHPPEDEELDVVRTTTVVQQHDFRHAVTGADLVAFQELIRKVPVSEAVLRYALNLVRTSRTKAGDAPEFVKKWVAYGASVRAAQYPRPRRQGPRRDAGAVPRQLRGYSRARAPGAAASRAAQLPRRVGGDHVGSGGRPAPRGGADADPRRCDGLSWTHPSPRPAPASSTRRCSRASAASTCSRARWWTASSTGCTRRPTWGCPSISPSTAATCRGTTSASSTGGCSPAPTASTSSSSRPTPTRTSR